MDGKAAEAKRIDKSLVELQKAIALCEIANSGLEDQVVKLEDLYAEDKKDTKKYRKKVEEVKDKIEECKNSFTQQKRAINRRFSTLIKKFKSEQEYLTGMDILAREMFLTACSERFDRIQNDIENLLKSVERYDNYHFLVDSWQKRIKSDEDFYNCLQALAEMKKVIEDEAIGESFLEEINMMMKSCHVQVKEKSPTQIVSGMFHDAFAFSDPTEKKEAFLKVKKEISRILERGNITRRDINELEEMREGIDSIVLELEKMEAL